MNVNSLTVKFLGALFVLLLATSGLTGVALAQDEEPEDVEISNYEGAKLGSVEDFRENSIRGVQEIDVEEYRLQVTGLVEEDSAFTYEELQ